MTTPRFIPTAPFGVGAPVEFGGGQAVASFAHAPGRVVEVYGAPGTGKTSVLIQRFVDLVRRHVVAPEQILVLAATRESAARLRDSLALALAGAGQNTASGSGAESGAFAGHDSAVEGSLARTASSVAFSVVRAHALANGLRAPELISGAEQDRIFTRLLHEHEFTQEVCVRAESNSTRRNHQQRPRQLPHLGGGNLLPPPYVRRGRLRKVLCKSRYFAGCFVANLPTES